MMIPIALRTVAADSAHAVETRISLIVPLLAVPVSLHTASPRIVPLCTVSTPLPAVAPLLSISPLAIPYPPLALLLPTHPTLSSLRFLAENVFSLRTTRRVKARVRVGVRANVDAGAALMMAGSPVGDVADAHC